MCTKTCIRIFITPYNGQKSGINPNVHQQWKRETNCDTVYSDNGLLCNNKKWNTYPVRSIYASPTICWIKEGEHQRVLTVWFHLYEVLNRISIFG